MSKTLLTGKDFKSLVTAVTKLPSTGAFANSELINLEVKDGICYASSFGIILSISQVPAQGKFPLVGIDERVLIPFSKLAPDNGKVLIEDTNGEIKIRMTGNKEMTVAFTKGSQYSIQPEGSSFQLTGDGAEKIAYLSDIAFSDSSRPELNAVYLAGDGRAVAVNQKCVSVLRYSDTQIPPTALPIPLARIISSEYTVYPGNETTIQNGNSAHSMPAPVKAQKEFPIGAVDLFEAAHKTALCTAKGSDFVQMLRECDACLGQIAKTEVVLKLGINKKGITLTSQNGGAKFRETIDCILLEESEIQMPLEEVTRSLPFLEIEEEIKIQKGSNGESYLILNDGFCMFPSWSQGKKAK